MAVANVSDTGLGASIGYSSTSFAARIKSFSLGSWTGGKLEDSTLASTTYKEYIPDDLVDPNDIEMEIYFSTSQALPTVNGAAETITLTFPQRTGAGGETASAASLSGTGFFTQVDWPELQIGSIQMATVRMSFDGKTGPTFTLGAAT